MWRGGRVAIAIIVSMLALLGLSQLFLRDNSEHLTVEQSINRYLQSGTVEAKYNRLLWQTAKDFVEKTNYEGKIRINQPWAKGAVNLYVFRNLKGTLSLAANNCAFVGADRIGRDKFLCIYYRANA